MQSPAFSTVSQAIDHLNAHGEPIYEAPPKWRKRGFDYFAPNAGQMLTTAQLIEFANNDRDLATETPALDAYDRHAAGASRCAAVIGLISADHPQLWTRDSLITRTAETLREEHGYSWESACVRAERVYAGTVLGSNVV